MVALRASVSGSLRPECICGGVLDLFTPFLQSPCPSPFVRSMPWAAFPWALRHLVRAHPHPGDTKHQHRSVPVSLVGQLSSFSCR